MDTYDSFLGILSEKYDTVSELKTSERSQISVLRSPRSGARYIFRRFKGNGSVYRELLKVSCRNLPRIYDVVDNGTETAVLEEYICGDTLAFLLQKGTFPVQTMKRIALQLCSALWVLHSAGIVHRDVKPENVIMRGDEAVLILHAV